MKSNSCNDLLKIYYLYPLHLHLYLYKIWELLIISRCYFFCNLWSLICWCITTIFIHQLLCIPYYIQLVFDFFLLYAILLYTIIIHSNKMLIVILSLRWLVTTYYIKMRFFVLVIRRNVIAVIVIIILYE